MVFDLENNEVVYLGSFSLFFFFFDELYIYDLYIKNYLYMIYDLYKVKLCFNSVEVNLRLLRLFRKNKRWVLIFFSGYLNEDGKIIVFFLISVSYFIGYNNM